jgi:hypothetical protein
MTMRLDNSKLQSILGDGPHTPAEDGAAITARPEPAVR